ncbi:4479_t:CDS:2, partial [Gigaspora margarita]
MEKKTNSESDLCSNSESLGISLISFISLISPKISVDNNAYFITCKQQVPFQSFVTPRANLSLIISRLPYVLAENETIDKYKERKDRFNVHGSWEWSAKHEKNGIILGDVTVYELPTQAHEVCILEITGLMIEQCRPVNRTDAKIYLLGATRTCAKGFCKEPDGSFRPDKSAVDLPNGSDGLTAPWPNIVIEVASSESVSHAKDKARNYWLHGNRVHDVIIVKLYYDSKSPVPNRMKAWHYCALGTSVQQKLKPKNKFEFGTHDANGDLLNYEEETCVIKIPLDCLYHDVEPSIQVPR